MQSMSGRARSKTPALAYVEGWHVIAEANRIFGSMRGTDTRSPRAAFGQARRNHHFGAAYIAKVRIAVRAGADRDHARRLWEWERQGFNPGRSA